MNIVRKIRFALRGGVSARSALLEAARRSRAVWERARERELLRQGTKDGHVGDGASLGGRLSDDFAGLDASALLEHFRTRRAPRYLSGFEMERVGTAQRELFPDQTDVLLAQARDIVERHRWPLLGYGAREFGAEIEWRRDPLSGLLWPPAYHAEIRLLRGDGSDARVLWELNRLSHLLTLGRAYAVSKDASFAEEFFRQMESWRAQNPVGFGPNWNCAMEAALRSLNLLAAFRLFRDAPQLDEARLLSLLSMFDEHGAHIRRNLEFSHLVTSNHYLSDVAGLFWLGVCVPELRAAAGWREFGLGEMLKEMDKQVFPDGADAEASTGYHRLVVELFLYSFLLARANRIEIPERYWLKLRSMLDYMRAYLRPDGRAPLIGDTDSGQVLPVARRSADDHAYVLAVGAVLFDEPRFHTGEEVPEELLWLLAKEGVESYRRMRPVDVGEGRTVVPAASAAFRDAGTYVLGDGDLYLLFNASCAGLGGRGSHGHNDALSVEVSACGASLIADPGTYVYTSDLEERERFRSTRYHSTVGVDSAEQNSTETSHPFIIGDEAHPRVLLWETAPERDRVVAEHDGYRRLPQPVTHRRSVLFDKRARYWLIEDSLTGSAAAEHLFSFRFHGAPGAEVRLCSDETIEVCDKMTAARLLIKALDITHAAIIEPLWSSRDYGSKTRTLAACWAVRARAPLRAAWALVPLCGGEDASERLKLVERSLGEREMSAPR